MNERCRGSGSPHQGTTAAAARPAGRARRRWVLVAVLACGFELACVAVSMTIVALVVRHKYYSLANAARSGSRFAAWCFLLTASDVDCPRAGHQTPLQAAASKGDVAMGKLLVEWGARVDTPNKEGRTALHWAAENGHGEFISFLATRGADPNKPGSDQQQRPLHLAARTGHLGAALALLRARGADPNVQNARRRTALHLAAEQGHVELCRALIQCGANPRLTDRWGMTPMYRPMQCRDRLQTARLMEVLIRGGGELNGAERKGWTPLMYAVAVGNLELARLTVEHGADVTVADDNGSTALERAVGNGLSDIVRFLLDKGAEITERTLDRATSPRRRDMLELLFQDGQATSNPASASTRRLLVTAAGRERYDVVKRLLGAGADVNGAGDRGRTPLHAAANSGSLEMTEFLLARGADPKAATAHGVPLLSWRVWREYPKVVARLLERGADAARPPDGQTPFLYDAARRGDADLVALLLRQGAAVNAADPWGRTALQSAVSQRHVAVVRELLKHGADTEVAVPGGCTVLHWAAARGDTEIVKLLVAHGANVNAKDKGGRTPLAIAEARAGSKHVADLLREHGGKK